MRVIPLQLPRAEAASRPQVVCSMYGLLPAIIYVLGQSVHLLCSDFSSDRRIEA